MCMSCGCGDPNEDHGDPDNITLDDLKRAARAAQIDPSQAAGNIQESAEDLKSKETIQ